MEQQQKAPSIWEALATWAKTLKPWEQSIVALAIKHGRLSDEQIADVYRAFLKDAGLNTEGPDPVPVSFGVRASDEAGEAIQLARIDTLKGVNALPETAALTFGPNLTVIYGRSGAGKSGFVRLLANTCFCRHNPEIIPNIYDDNAPAVASARLYLKVGGQDLGPLSFPDGEHLEKLKTISVFDRFVAERHLSGAMSFEFKPSGFDVFPEMARTYAALARLLSLDIANRTSENLFSKSFLGDATVVSTEIENLGAESKIKELEKLAQFGEAEQARFAQVESQLQDLRSNSTASAIETLGEASTSVATVRNRLEVLAAGFTKYTGATRSELATRAREAAEAVAAASSDKFKQPYFKAVGSSEWEAFAKAAQALGRREHEHYPGEDAHCLLCERPLDADSRRHVALLFEFVEGEAQKDAEGADEAIAKEVEKLQALDFAIFPEGSIVRGHVRKLAPSLETTLAGAVAALSGLRDCAVQALQGRSSMGDLADIEATRKAIDALLTQIAEDVVRLGKENPEEAIRELEKERHLLRHRELLSKIISDVTKFVTDSVWCSKAEKARLRLNTKRITDKEKELFTTVIGEGYRERLAAECKALDCELPVEMRTVGRGGETQRALTMKGGHKPPEILSEGEQKALALADFLTEVGINPASGGIILDDPVSSQDHQRKELIAARLVNEAAARQVIVFTHDLVFLNQIVSSAEEAGTPLEKHRIDRDGDKPGLVALGDVPALSKDYDTPHKATEHLAKAKNAAGSERDDQIRQGMGALRRTVEELIPKQLLKGAVPRWSDRVIVGSLRKINWNDALADEIVDVFEKLSAYMEGHSHTDEATGAPPQAGDLERMIGKVADLIKRAKMPRK